MIPATSYTEQFDVVWNGGPLLPPRAEQTWMGRIPPTEDDGTPGSHAKIPCSKKQIVISLRRSGLSLSQINKVTGVSRRSASKILKEAGEF